MAWTIIKKRNKVMGYQLLSAESRENYRKDGYTLVYAHDEQTCKRIMNFIKGGQIK